MKCRLPDCSKRVASPLYALSRWERDARAHGFCSRLHWIAMLLVDA